MSIFDYFFKKGKKETENVSQPSSTYYQDNYPFGPYYPIINKRWDGEKTLGELGAVVRNVPDYERLRLRSYDAYATKDIVKIIASKHFAWTIGSGLKLQCEPNRTVLESEGLTNIKFEDFQKITEQRFMVYANSKQCDYLKEKNLHELAMDFFQGTFLGGDTLCVIRYDNNGPNAQFISGEHLSNPGIDSDFYSESMGKGYKIEHGVEIDEKGKHIAYYVNVKPKGPIIAAQYERIPAYGTTSGKRLAWLISGKKISPDHIRAVPEISQSLEKINKIDRYTEASVTKAEQAANIVYTIEHEEFSTGESPTDKLIADKKRITAIEVPSNMDLADGLANRITETTSGQAFNLTPGSSLKPHTSSADTSFSEFHGAIFDTISAASDMPPEVAMGKYNSNYSASRAAINSFGYMVGINRLRFANQFYIPFYKLWLEFQILQNKIQAKGYMENMENFMVTESFSQCRFIGKNMPHIDPLKEIKAIREMLGMKNDQALISREQAVELLNVGQWDENFMKSLEEEKLIPAEKITTEEHRDGGVQVIETKKPKK